jgi:DNA modification methylase
LFQGPFSSKTSRGVSGWTPDQVRGDGGLWGDSARMKNELYYGDNLDILRNKIKDETVDLCYIDPPFNSKRNYFQIYNNQGGEDRAQAQAFVDTWEWGDEAAEPSNRSFC